MDSFGSSGMGLPAGVISRRSLLLDGSSVLPGRPAINVRLSLNGGNPCRRRMVAACRSGPWAHITSMSVTALTAAALMLTAATVSAWALRWQRWHRNSAWFLRFSLALHPQRGQVWEVPWAGTFTNHVPFFSQCLSMSLWRVIDCWRYSIIKSVMDVTSRRISLTAWGRLYGFDKSTTSRLHLTGKLPPELRVEQFPNRRYYVVVPPESDGRCVVYARVSSNDQKDDLDRQVGRVVEWAIQQGHRPGEVVREIGFGLNGTRRRLRRLVADHTVKTIVVEHRDRLCRFGFEYLEAALAGRGVRVLVMEDNEVDDDLVRDVAEVMTSLCARLYGRRSARRRAEKAMEAANLG